MRILKFFWESSCMLTAIIKYYFTMIITKEIQKKKKKLLGTSIPMSSRRIGLFRNFLASYSNAYFSSLDTSLGHALSNANNRLKVVAHPTIEGHRTTIQ